MMCTATERLIVDHLKEAGERLVHPPSNVDELLCLLDLVECCLLWIDQPPSKSFENALAPLKETLAAEDLMTHSDIDVKVAVANCISELIRISAPAILYDDEQMKRVFRLIVDAFEGLSDTSSRSYSKRVWILESMARDPSCAVLLNLKCDAMILEMFQHFLNSIRDYHPERVFSDMETIMVLVLKESDDVSSELLSLLVDTVEEKDEYVLPTRRKLAKKVGNCFAKLKPDMIHHESVIAAECIGANANASDEHPVNESKSLEKAGADRTPQRANKVSLKATGSGLLDHALGRSSQSVVINADSLTYPSSPQKKPQCTDRNTDEAKAADTAEKVEADNLESKTVFIPKTEPGQAIKNTRAVSVDLKDLGGKEMVFTLMRWEKHHLDHMKEAVEGLVHPPSDVFHLLSHLNVVFSCLLWISQSSSISLKNQLFFLLDPLKKALVAEDLMRHSDIDVKVAVAACICVLTKVSAPAILYDDEQMKKVFWLIVGAFEGLSDTSSCYQKTRRSILGFLAKDLSYAVLLNLKCDAIVEMFRHFLNSIRDYHPEDVFSDMETIMTLVLKENDDVSVELHSLLLDSAGKKDEYVLPIRRKLAEKVIRNCAVNKGIKNCVGKLKPDLIHDETVFAAECDEANANASDEHPINESKSWEKVVGAVRKPMRVNKFSLKLENRFALLEELEPSEQTKAAYKADKKLYAIESWENSKKAALEAELKKIEERPRRKKAKYEEKMKKKAMIKAEYGEEIHKAEEIAGKCQASGATATTPMTLTCLIFFLFAFGGCLLIGYWIYENIV